MHYFTIFIWLSLKGQCHDIFCFWFFSWISFPPAPEYPIRTVKFSEIFTSKGAPTVSATPVVNLPPVSTIPAANLPLACRRCQRHQQQTMGTISSCRYLIVNLKAKIHIYVNSTFQSCPNKIIKILLIEDFFHLPPVSTTLVVNLELRISPRIFEKLRNGPNGKLRGLGETDSWKKPEVDISWHCPLKHSIEYIVASLEIVNALFSERTIQSEQIYNFQFA